MNATTLRIDATPALVTLPCAKRWPRALDGRGLRPIRATWHPWHAQRSPDDAGVLVPIISCPRCAREIPLVLGPDEAKRLAERATAGSKVPAPSEVDAKGHVTPETRCGCGWFAPVRLDGWDRWQILWCAVLKEDGRAMLKTLYVHAANVAEATWAIMTTRRDRKLISIAPVIRNDREQTILLTGLES
jgi:hypothetical protein